jgi:anti-sigma factor RsiW
MDVSENRKHRTDAELVAFLDGELETQARASVAEHLDTCWHCRARSGAHPPIRSPPPASY